MNPKKYSQKKNYPKKNKSFIKLKKKKNKKLHKRAESFGNENDLVIMKKNFDNLNEKELILSEKIEVTDGANIIIEEPEIKEDIKNNLKPDQYLIYKLTNKEEININYKNII